MNQMVIKNTIDKLSTVAELLYQENLVPAYAMLSETIPAYEAVVMRVSEESMQRRLIERLKQALDAMEMQDNTLLADIIQYELIEQLNELIQ